jgi:hypothetical protein
MKRIIINKNAPYSQESFAQESIITPALSLRFISVLLITLTFPQLMNKLKNLSYQVVAFGETPSDKLECY